MFTRSLYEQLKCIFLLTGCEKLYIESQKVIERLRYFLSTALSGRVALAIHYSWFWPFMVFHLMNCIILCTIS